MIDKIITLKNDEKYFIFLEKVLEKDKFYIGVKLKEDKYTNIFKVFIERKIENDIFFEEVNDEKILKVFVDIYLLENIK